MSRTPRRLRVVAPALLAGAALLSVAACGGATPVQSREHSVIAGVNGDVGKVLVRNAQLEINPDGTSGNLLVALFNEGDGTDALVSVTGPSGTFTLPTTSTTTSTATSSPAASDQDTTVALPVGTAAFLNQGSELITFTGADPVRVGDSVPLTLSFAAAGRLTLQVPVTDSTIGHVGGLQTASPQPGQANAANGDTGESASASPSASTTTP